MFRVALSVLCTVALLGQSFASDSSSAFVDACYREILGREADAGGRAHFVTLLDSGSLSGVGSSGFFPDEYQNRATDNGNFVDDLFRLPLVDHRLRRQFPHRTTRQRSVPCSHSGCGVFSQEGDRLNGIGLFLHSDGNGMTSAADLSVVSMSMPLAVSRIRPAYRPGWPPSPRTASAPMIFWLHSSWEPKPRPWAAPWTI